MNRLVTVLTAALLLGVAGPTAAQPTPWQPDRFSAGWVFTPSIVVGTLWDSNITMQNEGSDFIKGWVTLVNPRGEIDFNGRRTRLNVGYSGSFEAVPEFSELNRYDQRGRADFRRQLSQRATFSAHGGLTATPTTDHLVLSAGAVPFRNVGARLFDVSAGLEMDLSPRTKLSGGYGFQHVSFDQPDPLVFDLLLSGRTHTPSLALTHEVTSRLSWGGSWNYTLGISEASTERFSINKLGAVVTYRASPGMTASATLGVGHLQVTNPELSVWGPAFGGRVEHQRGAVTASARYERSFIPSYTFGGVMSDETVAGDVRVRFARGRAFVGGGLSHARTDPVEELQLGASMDSTWVRGFVGYQFVPWLRAEGFYGGSHQTTSISGNFDRTRIGIQFVTTKPMRIQ